MCNIWAKQYLDKLTSESQPCWPVDLLGKFPERRGSNLEEKRCSGTCHTEGSLTLRETFAANVIIATLLHFSNRQTSNCQQVTVEISKLHS